MSVEILDSTSGTLTFKISGVLKRSEMATAQRQASQIIRERADKVRFLVLMQDLVSVEQSADWGDTSFPALHDQFIEKIAVVGEKQFEVAAALFMGKGIRRVPIEYFTPGEEDRARTWLAAPLPASRH